MRSIEERQLKSIEGGSRTKIFSGQMNVEEIFECGDPSHIHEEANFFIVTDPATGQQVGLSNNRDTSALSMAYLG